MKKGFEKHGIKFQLVPPYLHRRIASERAMQTLKNHLISGLSTCDPNFPINQWDKLIPQASITLNLLRSSRRQPKLSAQACIFGNFDFNKTPIAVAGTKVVSYETPAQRRTFAPHGVDAFYVGPAEDHYRCVKVFVPATNDVRVVPTLDWFPSKIPFTKVTAETYLQQTANDLLDILK